MANKSSHNDIVLAEKLFIYENKTCIEIAGEIGKNRRTVETWKKKFGWDDKRTELIESRRALPQKIFEWYNLVMTGIEKALKAGEKVPASQYRLAAMLFDQIPKAEAVEKAASGAVAEKKFNKTEIIDAVRQAVGLEESDIENGENDEK